MGIVESVDQNGCCCGSKMNTDRNWVIPFVANTACDRFNVDPKRDCLLYERCVALRSRAMDDGKSDRRRFKATTTGQIYLKQAGRQAGML